MFENSLLPKNNSTLTQKNSFNSHRIKLESQKFSRNVRTMSDQELFLSTMIAQMFCHHTAYAQTVVSLPLHFQDRRHRKSALFSSKYIFQSICQFPIIQSVCLENVSQTIVDKCSRKYADLPSPFHKNLRGEPSKFWRTGK